MVTNASNGRSVASRDECYRLLADSRKRTLLEVVSERAPDGIAMDDLATHLVAETDGVDPESVSEEHRQRSLLACRHRDLPPLLEAGLLEKRAGTLHPGNHPIRDDPVFEAVLSGGRTDASDDLDAVLTALADERRRTALAVLSERNHPVSTRALARIVATREADRNDRAESHTALESVAVSLVHTHLPALEDIGLVTWDTETDRVAHANTSATNRHGHEEVDHGTPIAVDDARIRTRIERPLQN